MAWGKCSHNELIKDPPGFSMVGVGFCLGRIRLGWEEQNTAGTIKQSRAGLCLNATSGLGPPVGFLFRTHKDVLLLVLCFLCTLLFSFSSFSLRNLRVYLVFLCMPSPPTYKAPKGLSAVLQRDVLNDSSTFCAILL